MLVEGLPEISAQGTLSTGNGLSGMVKLYAALKLQAGHDLTFKISQLGGPVVIVPNAEPAPTVPTAAPNATVFERQKLKHLHIEPFRAENLDNWEPENEKRRRLRRCPGFQPPRAHINL